MTDSDSSNSDDESPPNEEDNEPLNDASTNDPRPPVANGHRYRANDVLLFRKEYFDAEEGGLGGLESPMLQRERNGTIIKLTRERPRGKNKGAFLYTVKFYDPITTVGRLPAHGPDDDPGIDNDHKNVQFMRELSGAGTKRKRNDDKIIHTLSISEYSIAEHVDRIGFVARFNISPRAAIGVIYQRITYRLESGGDEMSGEYTEAWTVNKSGIRQNGDDAFLVPVGWLNEPGTYRVHAVAWCELGKERDLWGTLHGTEVLRDPKEASVLRRDVLIEWDSYGNMRINDI